MIKRERSELARPDEILIVQEERVGRVPSRRFTIDLPQSPFYFSRPSFSLMNARISSAMLSSFVHCSL